MIGLTRASVVVTATWGASGTEPASYTVSPLHVSDRESPLWSKISSMAGAIDFSFFSQMKVKFPAALPGTADSLRFRDDKSPSGSFADFAQDLDGNDIQITSISNSLSSSRPVHVDIAGSPFLRPVICNSAGAAIEPGALSIEFWLSG